MGERERERPILAGSIRAAGPGMPRVAGRRWRPLPLVIFVPSRLPRRVTPLARKRAGAVQVRIVTFQFLCTNLGV